ncbi:hypothetical protein [Celeribacter naphthalenivorans]|uniref:hypothetical protein n=1 Tax=Celeribacter naphthalenivorans TaxID=1614694 RepID=UPI001CFB4F86|nr:hypothetical protein [Celeribacter naphthalenivorans]
METSQIAKLKAEVARREAELVSCREAGYSAYNDFLAARISDMKAELRRAE